MCRLAPISDREIRGDPRRNPRPVLPRAADTAWRDRRFALLVSAALLAGAVLRFWRLGHLGLWWDEAYSVRLGSLGAGAIVTESFSTDYSPPLYYLALHAWMSIVGNSEAAVRSLSALFGIASILLAYRLGAALFDRATAALAAWLLALSAFHVEYSQETRAYGLMACLALASMLAYVRLLSEGGASATAAYLLASVALLYTHVYGLFFVLAQHVHYPLARLQSRQDPPLSWRRWTGVHLALALLAAPVAALVLGRAGEAAIQGFWLARPTPGTLKASLAAYAGSPLLMWIFLALAAACALDLTTARGGRTAPRGLPPPALPAASRAGLLLSWLIVPLALPFLISQVAIPMYHTRYAIGALPAMVLLAAGGAMRCPAPLPRAACIALLLALSLISSARYLARADKEPWRDVVAHVEANARAGDLVLSDRVEVIRDSFGYYRKRHDLTFRDYDVQPPGLSQAELSELRRELAAAQPPPGRVWLVRCRSHDDRRDLPRLLAETRPRLAREQRWLARGIEVILFDQ